MRTVYPASASSPRLRSGNSALTTVVSGTSTRNSAHGSSRWRRRRCASAGTAGAGRRTPSSSSGCGAASSARRSLCATAPTGRRRVGAGTLRPVLQHPAPVSDPGQSNAEGSSLGTSGLTRKCASVAGHGAARRPRGGGGRDQTRRWTTERTLANFTRRTVQSMGSTSGFFFTFGNKRCDPPDGSPSSAIWLAAERRRRNVLNPKPVPCKKLRARAGKDVAQCDTRRQNQG